MRHDHEWKFEITATRPHTAVSFFVEPWTTWTPYWVRSRACSRKAAVQARPPLHHPAPVRGPAWDLHQWAAVAPAAPTGRQLDRPQAPARTPRSPPKAVPAAGACVLCASDVDGAHFIMRFFASVWAPGGSHACGPVVMFLEVGLGRSCLPTTTATRL